MKKNVMITFLFSLIPGLGQMYQEYMKRGISHLLVGGVALAICIVLQSGVPAIAVLVLMAYSFFDSFKLRNMAIRGEKSVEDKYIWEENEMFKAIPKGFFKKKNVAIGIALLAIGFYYLLNSFVLSLLYSMDVNSVVINLVYNIIRYIPSLVVALLAIYAGSKLISNRD